MSDPHEQGGISVTIKGDEPGGKFNDPKSPGTWIVFHGSPTRIKEQIVEVFDLPQEALDRALYDLVNEATKTFKAVTAVGSQLGGSVLSSGKGDGGSKPAPASDNAGGDVWAQAAAQRGDGQTNSVEKQQAEEEEAKDPILAALENCKTVAEVQQVWAENQSAFNGNPDYMAAYKARGKALS